MILRWQRRGNVGHRQGLKTKGLRAIGALFYFQRLFSHELEIEVRESLKFLATIYKIWMMRHVDVPEEISDALAKAYAGTADGATQAGQAEIHPRGRDCEWRSARATLVPAGAGRYRLQLNTALRKAAHADAGDVVSVELRLDRAPRTLPVPPDLRAGLKHHPKARKAFEALAPGTRRQFIQWYDSAKAPETRRRRLDRAIEVLLERAVFSRRR